MPPLALRLGFHDIYELIARWGHCWHGCSSWTVTYEMKQRLHLLAWAAGFLKTSE